MQCTFDRDESLFAMVLKLDGNSEISALGRTNLCYFMLKTFDKQSQTDFFPRKHLYSFMRAHHVLSYHPIWHPPKSYILH